MVDEIVTRQELIDAKRDAQDLGKAVNEKVIVSPRWGGDFKSLPLISAEFDAKTQDAQNTINSWQDAITQITVNDGVPALAVSTANGNNQQAVNDLGGVDYWAARAYQSNNEVRLTDGTIVISTIDNNSNNPNSNMTGWKKKNSADQIFDESGLSQQEVNNNNKKKLDTFIYISDFCDISGTQLADEGLAQALSLSATTQRMVVIDGTIRISKTVVQPVGSSVTCVGGLVFCDDVTGLTNSKMWHVPTGDNLPVTKIGTLVLSTTKNTTNYVDLDCIGIHVERARTNIDHIFTFGCRLGGVKTGTIGYEITIQSITCRCRSWVDSSIFGVDLSAQDGITGSIAVVGYPKGINLGGTNHVDFIHPWGLPATTNPDEYQNMQLLVALQIGTNSHVNHCYLDTVDTISYDTPATFTAGVCIIFNGYNSSIGKCYVLTHVQSAKNKIKLVAFNNTNNTIANLIVGDDSFVDKSNAIYYKTPKMKWQNFILDGNVTYFTNYFTYEIKDLIPGSSFTGNFVVRKLGRSEIDVTGNIGVSGSTEITEAYFRILCPDNLTLDFISPNLYQFTMLNLGTANYPLIVNVGNYLQLVKITSATGNYEYTPKTDIRAGVMAFKLRATNVTPIY